jgi:LPXTG-motif cell wall-anchored protein
VAGAGLGVLAFLVLSSSGLLVAALLRIRGAAHVLLAAYTAAFAEIVGLSLVLSPVDGVTRANLLTGSITILVALAAIWVLAGSPSLVLLPQPRPHRPTGREAPQLLLATVVALALVYVLALILFTPPNGWDPLNYHLPRAAFWVQSHHVGYIEPTYDERLNLNPPNAEIAFAYVLAVTRDETLIGLVQFFAALACALGVFALARRVGLARLEAGFGALLFLSLPIVALQASLSKNDLVVASFLVAAAVFVLGNRRRDLGIAAVATALAVGTKSTATYGVVLLLALALATSRQTGRAARVAAIAIGAVLGSFWYVVNAVDSGRLLGDQSAQQGVTAPLHGAANVVTAWGMLVDTLDVSGARGRDILLYGIAAVLLAAVLVRRRDRRAALVAAGIVATPFVFLGISEHVGRPSLVRLYDALDKPRGFLGEGSPAWPTVASDTASWFGAVGLLLVLGAVAGLWLRRRRRSATRVVAVLALAPALWFALVALSLSYNPWLGRFFIFPVALSASLWGVVSRWPPGASAASVLAALTMALSLVHYQEKPSGLRLLDRSSTGSVWTMKRWEVQSQHVPALGPLLHFAEEDVPAKASVALAFADNGFGYPFFGPHLDRHVVIVPFGSSAKEIRADWLVATPERATEIDGSCWQKAFSSSEGDVFRHNAGCA